MHTDIHVSPVCYLFLKIYGSRESGHFLIEITCSLNFQYLPLENINGVLCIKFIVFYIVWRLVGSDHCRDSFGPCVCHNFHYRWMFLLLLPTMWKMWWQLRTRLSWQLGHSMLYFVHSPSLLCGSPVVSVLLMSMLTIFISDFLS